MCRYWILKVLDPRQAQNLRLEKESISCVVTSRRLGYPCGSQELEKVMTYTECNTNAETIVTDIKGHRSRRGDHDGIDEASLYASCPSTRHPRWLKAFLQSQLY